jgi:hypothetical protein
MYSMCFYAWKIFEILYAKHIFTLFIFYTDLLNKINVVISYNSRWLLFFL